MSASSASSVLAGAGWRSSPVLVSEEACTLGGSSDFFVKDVSVDITNVDPTVFYPLVRDGY